MSTKPSRRLQFTKPNMVNLAYISTPWFVISQNDIIRLLQLQIHICHVRKVLLLRIKKIFKTERNLKVIKTLTKNENPKHYVFIIIIRIIIIN